MSNICVYNYDPNILTQRKVNAQFALLHQHLCYLESVNGTFTQVFTTNSASVTFTGLGTQASPLSATATSSGGGGLSIQYMWVVGGAANFSSPSPPGNGATTFTSTSLIGKIPVISRNGSIQMGINPANGNTYYTFNSTTGTVTFSAAIVTGEEITIQA
jgi:hypothetical protein